MQLANLDWNPSGHEPVSNSNHLVHFYYRTRTIFYVIRMISHGFFFLHLRIKCDSLQKKIERKKNQENNWGNFKILIFHGEMWGNMTSYASFYNLDVKQIKNRAFLTQTTAFVGVGHIIQVTSLCKKGVMQRYAIIVSKIREITSR